jgi:hypothetical protein
MANRFGIVGIASLLDKAWYCEAFNCHDS